MTDEAGDAALWAELAEMWQQRDPVPADLVERVLVAMATEDLDAEYELLNLVARTTELAGARGDSEALTISFSGGAFSMLLRVSQLDGDRRRVDGWVTPAQQMTVSVNQGDHNVDADVDSRGRFEIAQLASGPSRFWLFASPAAPAGGDRVLFATPTFEL